MKKQDENLFDAFVEEMRSDNELLMDKMDEAMKEQLRMSEFLQNNNITMEDLEDIVAKRMTPRERQQQRYAEALTRKNTSLLLGQQEMSAQARQDILNSGTIGMQQKRQQDINVKDRLKVVKDSLNARPIEMQQKIPSDLERRMTYYDHR